MAPPDFFSPSLHGFTWIFTAIQYDLTFTSVSAMPPFPSKVPGGHEFGVDVIQASTDAHHTVRSPWDTPSHLFKL